MTKTNPIQIKPLSEGDLLAQRKEGDFIYPRYQGESILNILPNPAYHFSDHRFGAQFGSSAGLISALSAGYHAKILA